MAADRFIHLLFAALLPAFEQGGNLLAESQIRMAQTDRLCFVCQIRAENQRDFQRYRAAIQSEFQRTKTINLFCVTAYYKSDSGMLTLRLTVCKFILSAG